MGTVHSCTDYVGAEAISVQVGAWSLKARGVKREGESNGKGSQTGRGVKREGESNGKGSQMGRP